MSGVVDIKIRFLPAATLLMGGKFRKRLSKEFNRAAFVVGSKTAATMRKVVSGGVDPVNSQFTSQVKGSTKQLVDSGRLFKAITHRVTKGSGGLPGAIHVGVVRSSPRANVAVIVHRGAKIRVTRRMQLLFGVLSAISLGKSRKLTSPRAEELASKPGAFYFPLREGTEITVPPRPFAAITFADPRIRAMAQREFALALRRAVLKK